MKNRLKIILAVTVVSGILSLLLLRLLPIGTVKDELQVIICFIMGIAFLGGIFWMFLWKKSYRIDYRKNVLKEDISKEFEKTYKDLYERNILSLEKNRKEIKRRYLVLITGIIILYIGTLCNNIAIVFLGLILVIKFVRDNNKYTKIYEESYKKEIMEAFIKLINNQLEYTPVVAQPQIIKADYKAAEFDNKVFNIFSSDDYLEGTLENDIFIKMCDLNIQNQTRTRTKTHVEDIFQGIFVYTKSKKDIGTYVKILRNKRKIVESKEKIKMDSCEFEKYFDVYSDNNIITMQILTSDIMELLVEFYNKYQLDYEVVIKNNTIYMRFFTGPMFEPEIFVNSMDKQLLHVYFGTFQFIVEFSKKINEILQELEV